VFELKQACKNAQHASLGQQIKLVEF